MPVYQHPGVYIEEIPSGAKPIEGVATSVAAFVGRATRGPVGVATRISRLDEYVEEYGPIASEDDAMGFAVQAFYLNGGKAAYICRLAGAGSASADTEIAGEGASGAGPTADPSLVVQARNEGEWGNAVYARLIKPDIDSPTFDLEVGHQDSDGEFVLDEAFTGLSMRAGDDAFAVDVINRESALIRLALGPAADPADPSEQYRDAVLTGGTLASDPAHFTGIIGGPSTMTLNLNGLGARVITIDPVLGGVDQDVDGAAVAQAIEDAVRALSPNDPYQVFTCAYTPGANPNFVLTVPEDESQASIAVFGGPLADGLRLSPTRAAALTGAAVGSAGTFFRSPGTGIPSLADHTLTLDIDNLGDITIELDPDALAFVGTNQADGTTVALAIEAAVRAVEPRVAAYRDFTCDYSPGREFVLRSGNGSPRRSGLSVTDGELADFLGLNAADAPVLVLGRQVEHGSSNVVPVEELGLNGQGQALEDGTEFAATANDFANFYSTVLRKVRDVRAIMVPGEHWAADGTGNPILAQTLAHCEAMQDRMVLIDPPPELELEQAGQIDGLVLPTSTYSVLYYPWVQVANPLFNEDTNPGAPRTVDIAPSALAAGIWTKIDNRRGVWKAPAGVEAQLTGAAGLVYRIEDAEQDVLNPLGVNAFRPQPGFGSVVWGSRTLATKADPEWRYVPVRRTAIFIEQSIYGGIQWAVFEPNNHPLWSALRANVGSFMNGLFRVGAFQGETADQAYFVRCGLGDTMTQGDIDRGQVILIVGFAPLKPAEFVILRIQQKVSQQ